MLVHMLVTGSNASAIAAIEEATGDGLRLTQDDADRIMTMLGEASPTPVAPSAEAAIEEARRQVDSFAGIVDTTRSEEHTSELQSLMRISYAVFCLKKKKNTLK